MPLPSSSESYYSSTRLKISWEQWKKTIQHIVHNLTYNPKPQKERKRLHCQFTLQKIDLLQSIEEKGTVSEKQASFYQSNADELRSGVYVALSAFLKKQYVQLYETCSQEYKNGTFQWEKLSHEEFQLLTW